MKYLEANGFETKEYVSPDDIDRIIVTKYPAEGDKDVVYYEEYTYSSYDEAVAVEEVNSVMETYSDPAQIQEIMAHAYPGCLSYEWWYMEGPMEECYEIKVFFKEETPGYAEYGYMTYFDFLKDEVPAFVVADLAEETTE